MNATAGRGRPLRFLILLVAAWIGLRIATWTDPWPVPVPSLGAPLLAAAQGDTVGPREVMARQVEKAAVPASVYAPGGPLPPPMGRVEPLPLEAPPLAPLPERPLFAAGRAAASSNLLWMAGMAALPLPKAVAKVLDQASAPALPDPKGARAAGLEQSLAKAGRWRFDGWVQWRPEGGASNRGVARGSPLGGSQVGSILSFRLLNGRRDGAVFVRLSGSPGWAGRTASAELAAGLRLQPFPGIPVQAQAELRAVRQGSAVRLAPAALLAGGVEDAPLPLGAKVRAYGAAGWVGGEAPTGFVEGQAVAEREVADFDLARISAGVGSWGGTQRGAARLDVGPSLSAVVPVGGTSARLQIDYRVRIAGDATPASGPALTLSTGF